MTPSTERYRFNEALQNNTSFASLRACPDEPNICYMYTTVGGDGEKFSKRNIKEGLFPRPQLFAEHAFFLKFVLESDCDDMCIRGDHSYMRFKMVIHNCIWIPRGIIMFIYKLPILCWDNQDYA